MSVHQPSRLSLGQYADRFRNEMIPLGNRFCYHSAPSPLSEDERKDYLDEPVAALPPVIAARLPEVKILLVPYLERAAKSAESLMVSTVKPHESNSLAAGAVLDKGGAVLAFAINDGEVADYHYRFYCALAGLIAGPQGEDVPAEYVKLLRAELEQHVHGEVDEPGWRFKMELTDADVKNSKRSSKRFRLYARQSYVDTLTLYMHGICCDIDVETGPRQLPSNFLRKRLKLIQGLYPPPSGYAVFPEELRSRQDPRT